MMRMAEIESGKFLLSGHVDVSVLMAATAVVDICAAPSSQL